MSETNPYAPPSAPVADMPERVDASREPVFFAVSLRKLALMSLCTLGIYQVYWFYRNWTFISYQERTPLSAIWRALFAIFFCYSCFSRIRDFDHPAVPKRSLPAGPLAVGFIIVSLLWRLPDPYWLVCLGAFAFLLPVQRRANEINGAVEPEHDRNERFTGLNWVALIVGGIFLLLAAIGTLLPPPQ